MNLPQPVSSPHCATRMARDCFFGSEPISLTQASCSAWNISSLLTGVRTSGSSSGIKFSLLLNGVAAALHRIEQGLAPPLIEPAVLLAAAHVVTHVEEDGRIFVERGHPLLPLRAAVEVAIHHAEV